jgi:phosphoadenosine phosphosulfate reductase
MNLTELNNSITGRSAAESLKIIASAFSGRTIFTTSLGLEDQVITYIIFSNNIPVEIVTLDTGRLFPETYKVLNETTKKYQSGISVYFPEHEEVERMVTEKGPFSFYYSRENRLECCQLRKVNPLNRALEGKECWISGIRAGQSDSRSRLDRVEYDNDRKLYKFYPLFSWSYEEIRSYIKENDIPYNILHDKGYISIGCEPCTRAVRDGEDFRAGRWWWENGSQKECGLHTKQD